MYPLSPALLWKVHLDLGPGGEELHLGGYSAEVETLGRMKLRLGAEVNPGGQAGGTGVNVSLGTNAIIYGV